MDGVTRKTFKMDATRTYYRRWGSWLEMPSLPCDGILTLGQIAEKGGAVDEAVYGVEECPCNIPGGRQFIVRKLGAAHGAPDEQYLTTILPRSSQCTCRAGLTRTEVCRHRSGLATLIEAGMLPARELQGC